MEVLKVSLNSLSTLMYCGRIGNLNKNLPFFCKEDKKEAIKIFTFVKGLCARKNFNLWGAQSDYQMENRTRKVVHSVK